MDSPAAGGDRTESPRRLRREPRAAPRAGIRRPRRQIHAGAMRVLRGGPDNFGPNSISQAAVFVAVCEGYLGIEVHWDLWIHLFRGELFIENVRGQPKRFARAGGLMLHVRPSWKNLYIPNRMTTNNAGWTRGWFYLCNFGN